MKKSTVFILIIVILGAAYVVKEVSGRKKMVDHIVSEDEVGPAPAPKPAEGAAPAPAADPAAPNAAENE